MLSRLGVALILVLSTGTLLSAAPASPGPAPCALELHARDASGLTVLQTVAYALDRPGLVLTTLSPAARLRPGWERLETVPDPALSGNGAPSAPARVTEILLQDTDRDLLLLRAPGVEACDATREATQTEETHGEGEPLFGIRDRDGYRPRVFQARLDRRIDTGAGGTLIRVQIPDGGGAASGFLFDRHNHLIGSILTPPPGADRGYACAMMLDRHELDEAAALKGESAAGALPSAVGGGTRGAAALWTQALLLTRDDQTDQALRLLDEVQRLKGVSDLLLLERGARLFRVGRYDQAREDFSGAARLNPGLHRAFFNLGVTLGATGRYDEAITAFSRALEVDPQHSQTHYQLGLALATTRRIAAARHECDTLDTLDPALAKDLRSLLPN